jgi:hypothetical protein
MPGQGWLQGADSTVAGVTYYTWAVNSSSAQLFADNHLTNQDREIRNLMVMRECWLPA